MVFIQIIQGTVTDAEALRRSLARWQVELKPGAHGYLGSTSGVTSDGQGISLVRFATEADARANSERPEQGAWWSEAAKAYGDDIAFHNCTEIDTVLGGGSDAAGFVQVLQGRAKDQEAARRLIADASDELHALRPDLLGIVVAWHGDGGFTQAVYFTSLEEARAGEAATKDSDLGARFMSILAGEPTFFDLIDPEFD